MSMSMKEHVAQYKRTNNEVLAGMNGVPFDARAKLVDWIGARHIVTVYLLNAGCISVVCKKPGHVHTFSVITVFTLGERWEVSVDAEDQDAENAFKFLALRVNANR